MAVSKVDAFNQTLIDLTEDSVTPSDLPQGVTAHNSAGEQITGTKTPTQHQNIFYANTPGWYRVGEGIRHTPISFIFSITKNYNNTNTCMGAVLVALANRVSKTQITQLYYLSENQDIPQIRIVNEGGADNYNVKFYLEIYYGNTFANMFGAMVEIIGSVYLEENYFQLYSGDEIIKDPIVADENYVTSFSFNGVNPGLLSDRAIYDLYGQPIVTTYMTKKLPEYGGYTDDEINESFQKAYDDAPGLSQTVSNMYIGVTKFNEILGGNYLLTTYKTGGVPYRNGWQKLEGYVGGYGFKKFKRGRANGDWGGWIEEK